MSKSKLKSFDEYWKEIVPVMWEVKQWDNERLKAMCKVAYEAGQRNALDRYHELLYAVGNKYPGESRHDTALRYIQQAESKDLSEAAQREIV